MKKLLGKAAAMIVMGAYLAFSGNAWAAICEKPDTCIWDDNYYGPGKPRHQFSRWDGNKFICWDVPASIISISECSKTANDTDKFIGYHSFCALLKTEVSQQAGIGTQGCNLHRITDINSKNFGKWKIELSTGGSANCSAICLDFDGTSNRCN